jgi:hypothetical protein
MLNGSLESNMNLLYIVVPEEGNTIDKVCPMLIYGTSSPPSAILDTLTL